MHQTPVLPQTSYSTLPFSLPLPGNMMRPRPEQLFVVRSRNASWWIWVSRPVGQSSVGTFPYLRPPIGPTTVSVGSVLFPTVPRVTLLCPPVHEGGGGHHPVNFFSFPSTCVSLETLVDLAIQLITCTDADIWVHWQEWAYGHVMLWLFFWTNLLDKGVFQQKLASLKVNCWLLKWKKSPR